jgi:hypothetical protein
MQHKLEAFSMESKNQTVWTVAIHKNNTVYIAEIETWKDTGSTRNYQP